MLNKNVGFILIGNLLFLIGVLGIATNYLQFGFFSPVIGIIGMALVVAGIYNLRLVKSSRGSAAMIKGGYSCLSNVGKLREKGDVETLLRVLEQERTRPSPVYPFNWITLNQEERHDEVYNRTIRALATFTDPRATAVLTDMYRRYRKDDLSPTHTIIEQAGLHLPYEEANELLFAVADADFDKSQRLVLDRLTRIIDKNGISSILSTVDSVRGMAFTLTDPYPEKFWANTYSLIGELGREDLYPLLLRGCQPHEWAQSSARGALMRLAGKKWFEPHRRAATEKLVEGFDSEPTNVCEALGAIGDESGIPVLLKHVPAAKSFIEADMIGFDGHFMHETYEDIIVAIRKIICRVGMPAMQLLVNTAGKEPELAQALDSVLDFQLDEAKTLYKSETEPEMFRKLAEAFGCYRIYQYTKYGCTFIKVNIDPSKPSDDEFPAWWDASNIVLVYQKVA